MPTREQIEKSYDAVLYGMTALRSNERLWNWAMDIVASKPQGALASLTIDDDIEEEFAGSYAQACDEAAVKSGKPLELKDRPVLRALLKMLIEQLMSQLPDLIGGLFPPAEPTT